jgi:predicted nucleic acid-binding protein
VTPVAFVLDASVAAAWLIDDEANPGCDALLEALEHEDGLVPPLWHAEIASVLRAAERRGRATEAQVASALGRLDALPIRTDEEPPTTRRAALVALSREHGLTAYDAAYLDLAMRVALPLATRDAALRRAAAAVGLRVLPG